MHQGVYESDVFSDIFDISDVHDFEGPFKTRVVTHIYRGPQKVKYKTYFYPSHWRPRPKLVPGIPILITFERFWLEMWPFWPILPHFGLFGLWPNAPNVAKSHQMW